MDRSRSVLRLDIGDDSLSPPDYPSTVIRWRSGTVTAVRREWAGAAEFMVTVDGDPIRALAYPALVGSPRIGDRVLLNVGALEAGLGTGGDALVGGLSGRPAARA